MCTVPPLLPQIILMVHPITPSKYPIHKVLPTLSHPLTGLDLRQVDWFQTVLTAVVEVDPEASIVVYPEPEVPAV